MTWPRAIFVLANWSAFLGGAACLLLAAVLAARSAAYARLEDLGARLGGGRCPRAGALLVGLLASGHAAAVKWAMYRRFQLTSDSAVVVHCAWNFVHGRGPVSSLEPPSHLAVHFSALALLLSPLLRIRGDAALFVLAYGAAIGAAIAGVYALAERRTGSAAAAGLAAALAFSHPLYQGLVGTIVEDSTWAPALFVWAAYFGESGNWGAAAALWAALLVAKEQAPFVLCGWGLYLAARREDRAWRAGALVVAASAACWAAEMALIRRFRGAGFDPRITDSWGYFRNLGGSPQAVLDLLLRRPWSLAAAVVWPPSKLAAAARLFFYAGFLPFCAGGAALAVLAPLAPHLLADPATGYHGLAGYYAGFVLGPLFWASAAGLSFLYAGPAARRRRFLAAGVLTVAGIGLLGSAGYYRPGLTPYAWDESVPKALRLIPPDAKVWSDSFLLAHAGLRRYVKKLPASLPDPLFETELFFPDRVLLSLHWAELADPSARDGVREFLERNGFRVIFQEKDLVLLAPPGDGLQPLRPAALPGAREPGRRAAVALPE